MASTPELMVKLSAQVRMKNYCTSDNSIFVVTRQTGRNTRRAGNQTRHFRIGHLLFLVRLASHLINLGLDINFTLTLPVTLAFLLVAVTLKKITAN